MPPKYALAVVAVLTACDQPTTTAPPAFSENDGSTAVGQPLRDLTAYETRLFTQGSIVFQQVFTPQTGLGPLFNGNACAACHEDPVVGGVGDEVETHATAYRRSTCNDLSSRGGPVIQDSMTPALRDALGIDSKPVPARATAVGHRTSPSILGFGLLDAIPDATILDLARRSNDDGVTGRPNRTPDGRLGRFGRKAQVASLSEFVASAFPNEMGVTTPADPTEPTVDGSTLPVDPMPDPELTQADVDAATTFVRLLAPPEPVDRDRLGDSVFAQIGCTACHTPKLRTGYSAVKALSHRYVHAYTDLLLHNMGSELADICFGAATPYEFRTEPLMGLHFKSAFLHDGRAESIDQAIRLHAGEATAARNRYVELRSYKRAAVLRFLQGL